MAEKDSKSKTSKAVPKPADAEKPAVKSVPRPSVPAKKAESGKTEPKKEEKKATSKATPGKAEPKKEEKKSVPGAEPKKEEPKQPVGRSKPKAEPKKEVKKSPSKTKPAEAAPAGRPVVAQEEFEGDIREEEDGGGNQSRVAAFMDSHRGRLIVMIAAAFLLVVTLVIGLVFTIGTENGTFGYAVNGTYETEKRAASLVGYSGKILDANVTRKIPSAEEISNEGRVEEKYYPRYGSTPVGVIGVDEAQQNLRAALIGEANYLCATGTANAGGGGGYTWMDEEGYLYSGTRADPVHATDANGNERKLYKHTSAAGMYGGDVSDEEPAIVKQITMRPRGYNGYGVTGVYAPAGEVVKIQISEADMNATGGITVHIGQALYNGQANNIWVAKNQMQRFPVILNTMQVNKNTAEFDEETGTYTAYVGSFLGGPLYIRNTVATFTATISGGVAYSHFILGYTTKEEFEKNAQSSAPYFDLEVWSYGVLHSGPKSQAKNFSYDDLYKAAVLWEKVAAVSTTGANQGIVFLYDPFVAAGAAVAFPGRRSVNCPMGWMASSLNYNAIVTSGSWGNFHEYHHNFQGYGVGNGGEVTNNGMTLVSYALFTKISSLRGIGNYGAAGLSGWNRYTTATWSLNDLLSIQRGGSPSNGKQGLAIYATLLHNFGPDHYIQAKVQQQSERYGQSYAGYLKAWQDITHNDMTYFFKDVLCGIGENEANELKNSEYPTFIPVSSVYQTGRSYVRDGKKEYAETMQPYVIPYGQEFSVDLRRYDAPDDQYASGSVVLPERFEYKIVKTSKPKYGSFVKSGTDGVFTFKPSSKSLRSGKIYVTLEVTDTLGEIATQRIELVLEFEQSHEMNKTVLERTTYTFTADKMYSDAEEAVKNNYKGAVSSVTRDASNPVQNCNTDIWFYPDDEATRKKYPDAPEEYFVKENTIVETRGKLFFKEAGKYRIYLRGRTNCAAYFTYEGKQLEKVATIKDCPAKNSDKFRPNDPNTYVDVTIKEDNSWVDFKTVLIVQTSPVSYLGLGVAQWQQPMFTMVEKFYDKNGKEVASEDDKNFDHKKTHYYNYQGVEVSADEANRTEPIEPVLTNQPYVNAYRSTYEIVSGNFETDYFYVRRNNYDYTDNVWQNREQTVIEDQCSYVKGSSGWGGAAAPDLSSLTDGNRNTWIHTADGCDFAKNPLVLVVDMGEVKPVNRMIVYSQYRPNGDWKVPKKFTLYGSLNGTDFFTVGEFADVPHERPTLTVNFKEKTFRYYKLVISESYGSHIIISEIEMWRVNEVMNGNRISPDSERLNYIGKWGAMQTPSGFGHVLVGKKFAKMSFEFTGTQFAILSSPEYGKNFEVYIDGNKVNSLDIGKNTGDAEVSYLSKKLSNKKHTVLIKCLGETNIDSVVLFSEE